jgi:hypothetical protein
MAYQQNIPSGTVPFDQDYLNVQGNFQQLNISYGVDHVPYSDTSGIPPAPGGISGMHTAIHLVPQAAPAALTGYGQLFNTTVNDGINNDQTLYFLTGGNLNLQLTRNFLPTATANGATFLPGGLILNWGISAILANGTPTVITFTQPYAADADVFSITLTRISSDTSSTANDVRIKTGTVIKTQFQVVQSSASGTSSIYWMAIGK